MTATTTSTSSAFWAATHPQDAALPLVDKSSTGCGCGSSAAPTTTAAKATTAPATSCCAPASSAKTGTTDA